MFSESMLFDNNTNEKSYIRLYYLPIKKAKKLLLAARMDNLMVCASSLIDIYKNEEYEGKTKLFKILFPSLYTVISNTQSGKFDKPFITSSYDPENPHEKTTYIAIEVNNKYEKESLICATEGMDLESKTDDLVGFFTDFVNDLKQLEVKKKTLDRERWKAYGKLALSLVATSVKIGSKFDLISSFLDSTVLPIDSNAFELDLDDFADGENIDFNTSFDNYSESNISFTGNRYDENTIDFLKKANDYGVDLPISVNQSTNSLYTAVDRDYNGGMTSIDKALTKTAIEKALNSGKISAEQCKDLLDSINKT